MMDQFLEKLEPFLGKTGCQIFDKNILAPLSWTGSDASLTQIYAAVGEKLITNKTTGKYFHPIAREVSKT